jgi:nitrite reductase/ring-hydroxylating ferredoxin subunit
MSNEQATPAAVPWTRQRFLARMALGCGGLFVGGWAWLVARAVRSSVSGELRRVVTSLRARDLEGARVLTDALLVAEAGTVLALDRHCPHLGCRVALAPDRTRWDCPCHGSRFRLHGELLRGPARRGLTPLRTSTDAHGRLVVEWP